MFTFCTAADIPMVADQSLDIADEVQYSIGSTVCSFSYVHIKLHVGLYICVCS